MNLNAYFEKIRPWIRPVMTCLLGSLLLLRPSTITSAFAWAVGFLISLVGAGLLVDAIFRKPVRFLQLLAGIILLPMGFSVIHDPATLVQRLTRFIGVIVLLYALRGVFNRSTPHDQPISGVACLVGSALIVMPNAIPKLVFTICGIILLIDGIGMLLDQKNARNVVPSSDDDIIDAR